MSPSVTWACRRTSLSTCKSGRPGWLSVSTDTLSFFSMSMDEDLTNPINLLCSVRSDYPGYCGVHYHPATHLPQEENPDCHCPHQRGQQVSVKCDLHQDLPVLFSRLKLKNNQICSHILKVRSRSDNNAV